MNLRELLHQDFGAELPISGGFGNSIENAIIIHRQGMNDYVATEHFILKCLGIGRGIKWRILKQELLINNNKRIDKVTIETEETTQWEIITQTENYYFDISECMGNKTQVANSFDEDEILLRIKQRMLELEQLNDFNKKCVDLLKSDKLFADSALSMEFMKVLLNDNSMPLFESMMENKKLPMMAVLNMIAKELH